MAAFMGMRGPGMWSEGERPENWRQTMLQLFPNGNMTLTAMTSMMGSEPTDDPVFNWFTKRWPARVGTYNNVYANATGTTTFSGNGVQAQGTNVYFVLNSANAGFATELRNGHTFRAGNETLNYGFKYIGQSPRAGGAVTIAAKLLTEGVTGANLATLDSQTGKTLVISGSAHAVGSDRPPATGYDPILNTNYCQTFKESIVLPRTTAQQNLRSRDPYRERMTEALQKHGENIERTLLYGEKYLTTGENGLEEYYTQGILAMLREYNADKTGSDSRIRSMGDNPGLPGFEVALDNALVDLFLYGSTEKMAIGSNRAVQALSHHVKEKDGTRFVYESREDSYGIRVMEWVTSQGTLYVKTHPLFSTDPILSNSLLMLEPRNIRTRMIMDTKHIPTTPNNRIDAIDEEFRAEFGWEYHHPETFMLLTSVA